MDNINLVSDGNSNTVKINDRLNVNENVKVVQSNLKNTSHNNKVMKPDFNEDRIDSGEDNKPNFRMLESDINLLANPKKTKQLSSSSEEDSDDTVSTESEDSQNDMGLAQDHDQLVGDPEDDEQENFTPFGNNNSDEESSSSSSGEEETLQSTSSGPRRPPERPKTIEEINAEKQEMLYRLDRMEANGFKPSRKFNMNSGYDDIKFEYERLKKQRDVDKSIKFQRKILMAVSSGVEFLNNKFDPFDIKLDGWSESLYENLHEYDEVFEELHEKYQSKVKVAPELRLLMMFGGSAFMFHLTNTLFKSKMPGLDQILSQNPDLANNVKQAAMNTMRKNEESSGNPDPLFGMMMNQAQNMMGPAAPRGGGQMRGPSGVDDILNMVNKPRVPEANPEDTISSVSSQGSGSKRIKMRKPKKDSKFVINLE